MTVRIRRTPGAPVVLGVDPSAAQPMETAAAPTASTRALRSRAASGKPSRGAKSPASKNAKPSPAKKPARGAKGSAPQKPVARGRAAGSSRKEPARAAKRGRAAKRPSAPELFSAVEEEIDKPAAKRGSKKRAATPLEAPIEVPATTPSPAPARPGRRATAESMAGKQRDISVSEFFMKNRHLLGFDSPARALLTTVKEAFDNSLDACEEAGILPSVRVELQEINEERYRVIVEDNGPGIVKAQVPKVFGKLLYGSKFHRLRQSRGQQGIGISAAGMYGQLTTGKPIVITSKTGKGRPAQHFEIVIDTARNTPNVSKDESIDWAPDHGTRVEIELSGTYKGGRRSVDEYIEQAGIANPHAEIHYQPPKGRPAVHIPRATQELPREPLEIKPHPYGVELGMLQKILQDSDARTLSSALQQEFSRVTPKVAEEILTLAKLGPRAKPVDLKPADIERLHHVIPKVKIFAPPSSCVVPIGEDLIRKGLEREIQAEFYVSATRPPAVYRGNPFQVEAGLAYGGALRDRGSNDDDDDPHTTTKQADAQEGPITLLRLANRVPLQYQQSGCAMFKSAVDTNWRSYGLTQPRGSLPQGPMVLLVHVASVWVPFTSESKEAVAHYPEILKEMQLALQECGRRLGTFLRRREAERHEQRRRSIFEMYIGELVESLGNLSGADRAKLQKDLMVLARRHTGDDDEEIAAMLAATKKVAKRDDELDDDEAGELEPAPPRRAPAKSKSKAGAAGKSTVKAPAKSTAKSAGVATAPKRRRRKDASQLELLPGEEDES